MGREGLEIQLEVAGGACATEEDVAWGGRVERVGQVVDFTSDQGGFAGMADAGPAGPFGGNVAGFGEFQKALETGVPSGDEATAGEGDLWSLAGGSRGLMDGGGVGGNG